MMRARRLLVLTVLAFCRLRSPPKTKLLVPPGLSSALHSEAASPGLDRAEKRPSLHRLQAYRGERVVTFEHYDDVKRPLFGLNSKEITLCTNPPMVTKTPISSVPGAFLLNGALTAEECKQFIQISDSLGFLAYSPREDTTLPSCQLLVSDDVLDQLFHRLVQDIPEGMRGTAPLGFNGRWRIYKYGVNDTFKPHLDGGWPYQGVDPVSGSLKGFMDSQKYSQMTCLLYLNEDFDGGQTTFFKNTYEGLRAKAEVKPRAGAALCFFHGDHELSPWHEGSPVTQGTKYIIQCDIVFEPLLESALVFALMYAQRECTRFLGRLSS